MAEQDWIRPEMPAGLPGDLREPSRPAHFELRPLSLGELLDRTFSLYRSRFWLFAGIAMIAAVVNVVGQAISLAYAPKFAAQILTPSSDPKAAMASMASLGALQVKAYLVFLVFFLVSAITHAATAFALAAVYRAKPIGIREALTTVSPRWLRWIGIAFWQFGSFLWLPLLLLAPGFVTLGFGARGHNVVLTGVGAFLLMIGVLGGLPVGVILFLRNALAIPAAAIEDLPVRAAMRRSKVLMAGAKGRAFVVLLIAFCLLEVVGVLQAPAAVLIMAAPNREHYLATTLSLLLTFAGHTVVAPVALIGLTLLYFDQRVRKEALDLELLLERSGPLDEAATGSGARPEGYAPLS